MFILLKNQTGRHLDGILLSASAEKMRVVLRDHTDTLELCRIDAQWFSDWGTAVEIQSILAEDARAVERVWSAAAPRVSTAAS